MPRGDGSTERAARGDRPSLLPGGGLVLAVLAVLTFAGARQVDPSAVAPVPARVSAPPATDPAPSAAPADLAARPSEPVWNPARVATEPHAEPVLDPLARRTLEDPVRLARTGEYTLQIAVACRKETALGLLERAEGASELYVLPTQSQGQECYRFCWGAFDSRERAERATLPASLKAAGLGASAPRRIHELTELTR